MRPHPPQQFQRFTDITDFNPNFTSVDHWYNNTTVSIRLMDFATEDDADSSVVSKADN